MSKKMAMVLAGMLAASIIAATYAFTMNFGFASTTVPVTPLSIPKTREPSMHTRMITVRKAANNKPNRAGSTRSVAYPSPSDPAPMATPNGMSVPPHSSGEDPRTSSGSGDD